MKNMLILALLMASTAAYAQTAPGGGSVAAPPGQSGGAQAGGQGQGQPGERFEEHKAKIVARLQEKLACAQAAQSHEQMRACFPEREEHGGGGGWKGNGNGGGFGGGRTQNNGNGGNSGSAPGHQ